MKLSVALLVAGTTAVNLGQYSDGKRHGEGTIAFHGWNQTSVHWQDDTRVSQEERDLRKNDQDVENRDNLYPKNLHYKGPIVAHEKQKVMGFHANVFNCKNDQTDASSQKVIPFTKVCDGVDDCGDNSDEFDNLCNAKSHLRDKNGKHAGRVDWKGERVKMWDTDYQQPKKTHYFVKPTQSCCAAECEKMPGNKKDVADCKLGCGMWLSSSSLNYESKTWWPQLEYQCKKQCGMSSAIQAFRQRCVGNKRSPDCKIDESYWEEFNLTPAKTQICKMGCESYLGCMNSLEQQK